MSTLRGVTKKKRDCVRWGHGSASTHRLPILQWCVAFQHYLSEVSLLLAHYPSLHKCVSNPPAVPHVICSCMSSTSSKSDPLRTPLVFGNSQKSHSVRSGEYGWCFTLGSTVGCPPAAQRLGQNNVYFAEIPLFCWNSAIWLKNLCRNWYINAIPQRFHCSAEILLFRCDSDIPLKCWNTEKILHNAAKILLPNMLIL